MSTAEGGCLQSTGHSIQQSQCREGEVAGNIENWGSGAEPAAFACLWCLDLRHSLIMCRAVAHDAPSQNTLCVINMVIGGRKLQERSHRHHNEGAGPTEDYADVTAAIPSLPSPGTQEIILSCQSSTLVALSQPRPPTPALPLMLGQC